MPKSLKKFIIGDKSTIYVEVVDFGARLHHLGKHAGHNIIVAPVSVNDYLKDRNWMGSTVGPRAHIVRNGCFQHDQGVLSFDKNYLGHHLHGGENGFHRYRWKAEIHTNNTLKLGTTIKDCGRFTILYRVSRNMLSITYRAKVTNTSLINITNHSYFNLNRDDKIYTHRVQIDAEHFVATDNNNIALRQYLPVTDSSLDLRCRKSLDVLLQSNVDNAIKKTRGYNHCYLLSKRTTSQVEVSHPSLDWLLRITTSKPAIHFFTANNPHGLIKNKPWKHSALCLEPVYPTSDYLYMENAMSLLHPGHEYCETDHYQFIYQ